MRVAIIIEAAESDPIILFGSRATGTARPESDYDFLVVVPHVENERQVSRRIYHALLDHPIEAAVEIAVVDPATRAQHPDTPGTICHQALKGCVSISGPFCSFGPCMTAQPCFD